MIPVFLGNAAAQILLALPTAAAFRRSRRAGLVVWALTLIALAVGVIAFNYPLSTSAAFDWAFASLLAFFLLGPLVVAYALCRGNPTALVLIAFGIALTLAVLWIVLGSMSGATPG